MSKFDLIKESSKITAIGVAGGAVIAGVAPEPVQAQSSDLGLSFSVKGGLVTSTYSQDFFSEEGPGFEDKFGKDEGFYGAVSLGGPAFSDWDWRVSFQHLGLKENRVENTYSVGDDDDDDDGLEYLSNKFTSSELDFDLGRSWQSAQSEIRVGAGLRLAHMDQTFGKGYMEPGDFLDFDGDISFRGVGPVVSLDFTQALGAPGGFSLVAGGSVSPLHGTYDISVVVQDSEIDGGEDIVLESDDESGNVLSASAYIGLAKSFSPNSSFMVGYRVGRISGWGDTDDLGDGENINTQVGFVGMSMDF